MAANTTPIFVNKPRVYTALVQSNTTVQEDGSGAVIIVPETTEGVRLHSLICNSMATASGTTYLMLWMEKGGIKSLLASYLIANSSTPYVDLLALDWVDPNDKFLIVPSDCKLFVGTSTPISTKIHVTAMGGEY